MDTEVTTEDAPITDQVEPDDTAEQETPQEGGEGAEFNSDKALEKIRKLNSEAKGLRDRAKAAEQKVADGDALSKENADLASKVLRLQVAIKHGLPEGLASRLTGSTEAELLADAEELMSLFEAKRPPSLSPTPKALRASTPSPTDAPVDLDALVAEVIKH